MGVILLWGIICIPLLSFILIYSSYKVPIQHLEKQGVQVTSELKGKIRRRFMIAAIIIACGMFIFTLIGFGIGMTMHGVP